MSRSSMACRTTASEIASLPMDALMASSARETALSSRMFPGFRRAAEARLLRRSGDCTAKIRTAVSRSRRTSVAPQEVFDLFVRHRLPPVRIENLDSAFERTQYPWLAAGFLGAHQIYYRHSPAANGHRLTILHRFDQFGQLVLGVGYAELHRAMIAICDSYVKKFSVPGSQFSEKLQLNRPEANRHRPET